MSDIAEVKVTPDEEKIKEIVEEAIKDKLKEQFNLGLMAGWDACLVSIREQIKSLRSANKIKALIEKKIEERKVVSGIGG